MDTTQGGAVEDIEVDWPLLEVYGEDEYYRYSVAGRAWLAGFVDGEGSIGMHKEMAHGRLNMRPALQIVNTDKGSIDLVHGMIPEGQVNTPHRVLPNHRQQYHFALRRRKPLIAVIRSIEPHLVIKRRQAQIVLAYLHGRENSPGRGWHVPYTENDFRLYEELRYLNRRGIRV